MSAIPSQSTARPFLLGQRVELNERGIANLGPASRVPDVMLVDGYNAAGFVVIKDGRTGEWAGAYFPSSLKAWQLRIGGRP